MYSAMCSAAQKNEADIVVCGYYYIDENGKITSSSSLRENNITLRGIEKIKYNISTSNNCVLFDNANQVYVIFRVLGGFIAYVFCRCRGWPFIGYANSVHICFQSSKCFQ